jgi:hypothetical protein
MNRLSSVSKKSGAVHVILRLGEHAVPVWPCQDANRLRHQIVRLANDRVAASSGWRRCQLARSNRAPGNYKMGPVPEPSAIGPQKHRCGAFLSARH